MKLEGIKPLTAVEIRTQEQMPQIDDKPHVENVQMQHADYNGSGGNGGDGGDGDVALAEAATKKARPMQRNLPKVGRNDPCPCGSGKKYKKCCYLKG